MSEAEHHDVRGLTRYKIEKLVEVYDTNRGEYLGRLVNIHTEGLMVVGDELIKPDYIYQLEVRLVGGSNEVQVIRFGADCLWVRQLGESSTHWAGFHIIDLSDQAKQQIDHLVEELGE